MNYLGKNRGILKTVKGIKMFVNTQEKSITPHLVTDGTWEPNITSFITGFIKPGMNVLEVGANIGYYSCIIAAKIGPNGKLTCFEPNPYAFDLLKDNIEINGLRSRCLLVEAAVSNHNQDNAAFTVLNDHQVSSSLMGSYSLNKIEGGLYAAEKKECIGVQTMRLDDSIILEKDNLHLIKIDAEGYELDIFWGMEKLLEMNPKARLMVEFVPEYLDQVWHKAATDLIDLIESLNYKLAYIDDKGQLVATTKTELLSRHYSELFLEPK